MDKLRKALSGDDNYDEDSSTGIFSNLDSSMSLNWGTRIKAFACCFIVGVLLTLLSTVALFLHNVPGFAVLYTLGNIVSLARLLFRFFLNFDKTIKLFSIICLLMMENMCGSNKEKLSFLILRRNPFRYIELTYEISCFLMGPFKQIKKMFASTRIIATILVLVMLVLTIVCAWRKKAGLSLICIIIQSLAMTWYSLSYIPYARDAVKKTVSSCV